MLRPAALLLTLLLTACATPQGAPLAPTRSAFTTPDGTRLSYLELGKGPAVLLLHGFLGDAQRNWVDNGVMQCLAQRGRRVIALDLRAHGQSARPATPYAPDVLAADGEALVRHLKLRRWSLGGYSLGSRTAVRMLARGARPSQVALGGMGDSGIVAVDERKAVFRDLITNGAQSANPRVGGIVQQMIARGGLDRASMLAVLDQQRSTSPAELARLAVPVTIVNGTEDGDNGDPAALARLIPGAKVVAVPGNHLSALTAPEFRQAMCDALAGE